MDKWQAFAHARTARGRLGITDRDLAVLHALLSFLPARELRGGTPLVVFPSNATLADRAHGMAESTLRRHLAALVAAGLVARRDSPNGKRYAARTRAGDIAQAYGIDLRPLAERAPALARLAAEVEEEALALARDRAQVVVRLRDASKLAALARDLAPADGADPEPALHAVRQALRRRLDRGGLAALAARLSELLAPLRERILAAIPGGDDAHNERHLQDSDLKNHESEKGQDAIKAQPHDRAAPRTPDAEPTIPLALILKACPDLASYHTGPVRG